jgi:hypothetical protein
MANNKSSPENIVQFSREGLPVNRRQPTPSLV